MGRNHGWWRVLGQSQESRSRTCFSVLLFSISSMCLFAGCTSGPKATPQTTSPSAQVTVAVLEFEDHSIQTDFRMQGLGRTLADRITEDIVSRASVRVVDRDSLQRILEELALSSREITSPEERLRLGKLLGAQYLIMGGFTSFDKRLRIDGRIVSVEKGLTVGVSEEGLLEDRDLVEREFSQQIVDRLGPIAGVSKTEGPAASRDFVRRGLDFERSHEDQNALEMYKKALALDPQNQEAKERLERLLLKEIP